MNTCITFVTGCLTKCIALNETSARVFMVLQINTLCFVNGLNQESCRKLVKYYDCPEMRLAFQQPDGRIKSSSESSEL